jgi:hypothetical protein
MNSATANAWQSFALKLAFLILAALLIQRPPCQTAKYVLLRTRIVAFCRATA